MISHNESKSNAAEPLVSVIMPCFNAESSLSVSLGSVFQQTYSNYEVLVCDDGSSDGSLAVIKRFAEADPRVSLLSNQYQKGAAGARRTCIEHSRGDFLAFLDADDQWLPTKLSQQMLFMMENDLQITCTEYYSQVEGSSATELVKVPAVIDRNLMNYANFVGCLTVICHKRLLEKVIHPNIQKRNDYALWLNILMQNPKVEIFGMQQPLAVYRVHKTGLSANRFDALTYFYICQRKYAENSVIRATAHSGVYLLIVFLKKLMPSVYNRLITRINK